jgi:23S rRNA (cytidine2498-2'-O)-methyltransferase
MKPFLVSVAPASAELFRRELAQSDLAQAGDRLDEHRHLCSCYPDFESLFWLHRFPIQLQLELPDLQLETVSGLPWWELDLEWLGQSPYAIQVTANQRLEWNFPDLVQAIKAGFGLPDGRFQPRHPENILSAYFHRQGQCCRLFAGVSHREENLSAWASGHCRIPRDPQAVSRAEAKLLEAWEAFGLEKEPSGHALDLGAAPGGWTRVLASKGFQVQAVDPARLDPRVLSLATVAHHAETAGSFLSHSKGRFALIVSDMKMDPKLAAELLVRFAPRLDPSRGRLLATLKLGKGSSALQQARQALTILAESYTILQARQLYFNRSEITVLAKPSPG